MEYAFMCDTHDHIQIGLFSAKNQKQLLQLNNFTSQTLQNIIIKINHHHSRSDFLHQY